MTQYTYDEQIVSDLHKEAYGTRPREYWWQRWNNATSNGKQAIWDALIVAQEAEYARYVAEKKAARELFEKRIAETIAIGARDRKTALRWLLDTVERDYDVGYMLYQLNVPYEYEAECSEALKAA